MGETESRRWPGVGTRTQISLLGLSVAVRHEGTFAGGLRRLVRSEYPVGRRWAGMRDREFTNACGEGENTMRKRAPGILWCFRTRS